MKTTRIFAFAIAALMAVMTVSAMATCSEEALAERALTAAGSVTLCAIPALVNIKRVGDRVTAGSQIHYRIYLIHVDQVDTSKPFPKPSGREIGTIPLLSGQYWHYFEVVSYTPDDKSSSSKGDITSTVSNTLAFTLGGQRAEVYDFIENNQGELFYIVLQEIDTGKKYLYGREFNPYILQTFERSNNKDGRYTTVTFGNSSFDMPLEYVGAIELQPATAIAADATTVALTAAQQYVTSAENTAPTTIASFTGLSVNDEGRTIEIVGGGGTNPSQIAETDGIVLRNGTTWSGKAGSSIIFRVLDASTLVELSRIQTS